MTLLDVLIRLYIDVNILLAIALAAWFALTASARAGNLSVSAFARLRLLRLALTTAILCPIVLHAVPPTAALLGVEGPRLSLSPSDLVVALYLEGKIDMRPSEVEALIGSGPWLADRLGRMDGRLASILALGLAIGFVVYGLRLARNVAMLRRALRHCHAWRRSGKLQLLLSDSLAVPFATRSLQRRYIVLPSHLLCDRRDLRIAIAHEAQHHRNGDVDWELFFEGLRLMLFWNPALAIWKAKADQLKELACDRMVVQRKRVSVGDYCACLLRSSRWQRRIARLRDLPQPGHAPAAIGLLTSDKKAGALLRQRVMALLDGPRPADKTPVLVGPGLLLVGVIALAAVVIQPPAAASAHRLQLSTFVNLERMEQAKPERGYNLVMSY